MKTFDQFLNENQEPKLNGFDSFEKNIKVNESEVEISEMKTTAAQSIGDNIKKKFNKITEPKEPFKRDFTQEETKTLFKCFPMHSWSKIDADGNIVLGGGQDSRGMYYITEDDLKKLVDMKIKDPNRKNI